MPYYYRQGGTWRQGTPKSRQDGQFADNNTGTGTTGNVTPSGDGFSWDQTFTDTSWLFDADESGDLNVETVTTTDFGAPGGLEEAVDNASGDPTVVVFEVGGVIEVPGHNWRIRNEEIWFAGETAPWPGIYITQCRTRIHDPKVIFSHMGFLQGDEIDEFDSCVDIDASDVLMDHCTVAWGTEENIGMPGDGTSGHSIINSIIAEPLYDNPQHDDLRARNCLFGRSSTDIYETTFVGNLQAHVNRRMVMNRCWELVMGSNYTYNYTHNVESGSGSGGNIINFNSPQDPDVTAISIRFDEGAGTPSDYDRPIMSYDANVYTSDFDYPDRHPLSDGNQTMLDEPPVMSGNLSESDFVPTDELREWTMANSGARPADRGPYEEGLINDRLNDSANLVDSQDDVGGYPSAGTETHSLDVPSSDIVDWIFDNYTEPLVVA